MGATWGGTPAHSGIHVGRPSEGMMEPGLPAINVERSLGESESLLPPSSPMSFLITSNQKQQQRTAHANGSNLWDGDVLRNAEGSMVDDRAGEWRTARDLGPTLAAELEEEANLVEVEGSRLLPRSTLGLDGKLSSSNSSYLGTSLTRHGQIRG